METRAVSNPVRSRPSLQKVGKPDPAPRAVSAKQRIEVPRNGYRFAWERDRSHQALLREAGTELGLPEPETCWAQAAEGHPDAVAELGAAFEALKVCGRISRFPDRGITVARQATCAPYGLPAVLLKLKGTCRLYAERVGMCLLEANPRVVALTEVAPGIVLIENTPPLDHIRHDTRFWSAWRSLPEKAWKDIVACAAVRVLRYVEVGESRWEFYDSAFPDGGSIPTLEALSAVPHIPSIGEDEYLERWRQRRCRELGVVLRTGQGTDDASTNHALACLATPHPFLHEHVHLPGITKVEAYLGRAAVALQLSARGGGGNETVERAQGLATAAREGLWGILERLMALPPPTTLSRRDPVVHPACDCSTLPND